MPNRKIHGKKNALKIKQQNIVLQLLNIETKINLVYLTS